MAAKERHLILGFFIVNALGTKLWIIFVKMPFFAKFPSQFA